MVNNDTGLYSSNLNPELQRQVDDLLNEFLSAVSQISVTQPHRYATIRARLNYNKVVIIDDQQISLIGQLSHGMPSFRYLEQPGKVFSRDDLHGVAKFDIGFNDYFIVVFSKNLLNQTPENRNNHIERIAKEYVNEEMKRVDYMINIVKVSPLFGADDFRLNPKLVFVLMPFSNKRTAVYEDTIKPAVESMGFICRRADEITSINKAVIHDIWRFICEARLIIADLSDKNENVMYELGVSHTVGKPTILLSEKSPKRKIPFDLAHIRRIEYTNDAKSMQKLTRDIVEAIESELRGKSLN